MRLAKVIENHPIPFLLYFEWASFVAIVSSEILKLFLSQDFPLFIINAGCLFLFFGMGFFIPQENNIYKIFLSVSGIFLFLFLAIFGKTRIIILVYVILIIRNCLFFNIRTSWILNGLISGLCLIILRYQFLYLRIPLSRISAEERKLFFITNFLFLFCLFWIFIQLLVSSIFSDRASKVELAIANEQLRQYALRIEDIATLQERNRIAREIHDSLGHYLTVLNINLEAAWKLRKINNEESLEFLADAKKMGSMALDEIRESVAALRSDPFQSRSLEEAVCDLVSDFRTSNHFHVQTQITLNKPVSCEVKTAVYRIVQESLTNIRKYADATEVKIEIKSDRHLSLKVVDNGKGFDLNQNTTGFGLQGMRERTLALGGDFEIVTSISSGCMILATFPLYSPKISIEG